MYNVAVVGATGNVGRKFLEILEERNFPIKELFLFASKKSQGKIMKFKGQDFIVEELCEENIKNKKIDFALFSAGGDTSLKFAPTFAKEGAIVIDNSSAWRMDPKVPLVVPEVNPEDIKWHNGIIANPNCSTIQAMVALKPLHDKSGNTKNTYNLAYNTVTNQITLTIVNTTENTAKTLNAYTEGNLDYETIEIKCKVAQEPDTKNQIVLTNVAWIDEEYNADDKTTITNQKGADRDSEPNTSPNVNKDNMSNYKGNSNNKDDLTDSKYHYEGQQDDDDFEKLVIMPEEKIFDLALFKHIAAISKDQTIENGEYVTDNKNIDGTYLRAPVVTNINKETGKITYKQDDKEALVVEPGDYVLYTIRVYNEGEVNGYASKNL